MGSSSPIFGVKITNIWNHHLAHHVFVCIWRILDVCRATWLFLQKEARVLSLFPTASNMEATILASKYCDNPYHERPADQTTRLVLRMIHVKDSRSYQGAKYAKYAIWTSWVYSMYNYISMYIFKHIYILINSNDKFGLFWWERKWLRAPNAPILHTL